MDNNRLQQPGLQAAPSVSAGPARRRPGGASGSAWAQLIPVTPSKRAELHGLDRPRLGRTRAILSALVAVLLLAMISPVAYIAIDTFRSSQNQSGSIEQKSVNEYLVTSVPLDDLVKQGDVTISSSQVNINGQLRINNSFVLTPSQAPTNPAVGQFYFDQDSNQLYYYNGTQFVDVATGSELAQVSSTVQAGSFESLSLGAGLERVGSRLINTGVLALPQDLSVASTPDFGGLNLASALSVGSGGTGATNTSDARINLGAAASGANADITSLTALTAVSPLAGVTYQFAAAAPGDYDFCTTAGNCATAGAITGSGTSGRLAKFTAGQVIADSLLSESANTVTADGNLKVEQSAAVGNAGIIQDSGASRVTLDASQSYSDTSGLTSADGLNARVRINDTSNNSLAVTGSYSEAVINRSGNFGGWGYGSYSYLENNTTGNTNYINGSVSHAWNFSAGTTSIGSGLSTLYTTDSGLTDWAYGSRSYVSAGADSSINNAIGVNSRIENFGTGTISNGYGVLVQSASNASGLFENNYGLYVQDQSGVGSVNSFNIYSAGSSAKNNIEGSLQVGSANSTSRLNIGTDADTTAAGGITFGTDTNLYRGEANQLKSDSRLYVVSNYGPDSPSTGYTPAINGTLASDSSNLVDGGINGLYGAGYYYGAGTLGTAIGVVGRNYNEWGGGTITDSVAIQAENPSLMGGSITNNYGLRVMNQTAGTNNYGVYVQGASTYALFVDSGATRLDGNTFVRNTSPTAFEVQNAVGTSLLTADTTNMTVTVQALAVTGNLTVNGHLITGGGTPSAVANANAGVGASCVVSGTDTAGTVTVTTGSSGVAAGTQCTITFSSAFGAAPRVVVGPSNSAASPLDPYIGSTATGNFTIGVGTAGSTSTVYRFDYIAAQ